MFYLVYQITNNLNNKIYVGVHETNNLNDSYMGSGHILKIAQQKYGIENFSKKILHICNSPEEMFLFESQIVNNEFIQRKDTYNLKVGGWAFVNSMDSKHLLHIRSKGGLTCLAQNKGVFSSFSKKKAKDVIRSNYPEWTFGGKSHSEETKKIIGNKSSLHQKGSGNSQFGSLWIYSLELKINKKIKQEELNLYLSDGWKKGRKIKF